MTMRALSFEKVRMQAQEKDGFGQRPMMLPSRCLSAFPLTLILLVYRFKRYPVTIGSQDF